MIPYNSRLVQISRASGAICSWAFTNDIEPERTKRFATALAHSALMPTGRRSSGLTRAEKFARGRFQSEIVGGKFPFRSNPGFQNCWPSSAPTKCAILGSCCK